jgi:hypothetical protein
MPSQKESQGDFSETSLDSRVGEHMYGGWGVNDSVCIGIVAAWFHFWEEIEKTCRILLKAQSNSSNPEFFKKAANDPKFAKQEAEKKLNEAERKLSNEESKNLGLEQKLKEREAVYKQAQQRGERLTEMEEKLKRRNSDAKRSLEEKRAKSKELESKTSSAEHQEPVRRLSRG